MEQAIENRRVCGAKTRRGTVCQATPMPNGRCNKHGGMTPRGPANANFVHGKYSKFLPKGLRGDVERLLSDPDLISLRDDLALGQARIGQLLEGIDEATGSFWEDMAIYAGQMRLAIKERDKVALMKMLLACQHRNGEVALWREIRATQTVQVRLADAERKRIRDAQAFITKDELLVTVFHVLQIIVEVCGREAAKEVGRRMGTLLGQTAEGQQALAYGSGILDKAVALSQEGEEDEE